MFCDYSYHVGSIKRKKTQMRKVLFVVFLANLLSIWILKIIVITVISTDYGYLVLNIVDNIFM